MEQNPLTELSAAGTSVWLDQLSRTLIREGRLEAMIGEVALSGVTSNPAIFQKAMTAGNAYDEQIAELRKENLEIEPFYERLAVRDIQEACDALRPVYDRCHGSDGFVSLEVSPHLARDAEASIVAAHRLHKAVGRPNVLIKIPGTPECVPAVDALLVDGIGVNITLLFSVEAYEAVAWAYVRALTKRHAKNQPLKVPSVASFFVSRIDTLVDSLLEEKAAEARSDGARAEILGLRGKIAVANAKLAYQSYRTIFCRPEFMGLEKDGARVQKPLWASTSTKNPEYSDIMYVEPLIGRETVNTMPLETIEAFRDHGKVVRDSVEENVEEARARMKKLEEIGISFKAVTDQLLEEGIAKFNEPYDKLLRALDDKRKG